MADKCPYCDFEANDTQEEIDHMNAMHPEIIRERLEKAGMPMVPDTYEQVTTREWLAVRRERDRLREIIGRLYVMRGKDINTLRTAIRRAFREANDG